MTAWKIGAALLQDGFHHGGEARQQQLFGNPKVGDAPVRMRETLRDGQTLQSRLIDGCSARHSDDGARGGGAGHLLERRLGWGRGERQRAPMQIAATSGYYRPSPA